jgi:hypothetical protein
MDSQERRDLPGKAGDALSIFSFGIEMSRKAMTDDPHNIPGFVRWGQSQNGLVAAKTLLQR